MPLQHLVENLREHPSLQEKVYDHLKRAILSGEIQPGERLLETRLAEALNVSRIPVREAIRKLEREGLIVVFPRRGVYASSLSPRDIDEVYTVRTVLEGLAARLAAEHRTDAHLRQLDAVLARMTEQVEHGDSAGLFATGREFHQVVLDAAANQKLNQLMDLMRSQVERVRKLRMQVGRRTHDVLAEYRSMRDAIAARDGARAEREMRVHVDRPRQALMGMLQAPAVVENEPAAG